MGGRGCRRERGNDGFTRIVSGPPSRRHSSAFRDRASSRCASFFALLSRGSSLPGCSTSFRRGGLGGLLWKSRVEASQMCRFGPSQYDIVYLRPLWVNGSRRGRGRTPRIGLPAPTIRIGPPRPSPLAALGLAFLA